MFKLHRALVVGGALGVVALLVGAIQAQRTLDDTLSLAFWSSPWVALLVALACAVHAATPRRIRWVRRCSIAVSVPCFFVAFLAVFAFFPLALVPALAAFVPLYATRSGTELGIVAVGIYAGVMSTLVAAIWGGWYLVAPISLTIGAVLWAREARAAAWTAVWSSALPRATVRG